MNALVWLGAGMLLGLASGCGRHVEVEPLPAPQAAPPPVHSQSNRPAQSKPSPAHPAQPARIAPTPAPPGGVSADDLDYIQTHKPILTEEGLATWYTAAKGRESANGQLFSDHALTAAHRTLPMGSLIVVTNLTSNQSSPMRITDRGPFVEGRILDLTIASAKATGIYRMGTAEVRLDVYRAPKPIDTGGRWCVQIGAFTSARKANKLKSQLERKYPDAKIIEFPGEASYWVRIRPQGDDRAQAERIARKLHPAEGKAFLTRLD
ncbi:MAG: septal ring lytic transglycosylase RlpA family protein [Terracidiphilus sp.]